MATFQTVYTEAPEIGLPGQVANSELKNEVSAVCQAAIPFGYPAYRGTVEGTARQYTGGADFLGITRLTPSVKSKAVNPDSYSANETGAFVTLGAVYVSAAATVTHGEAAYWDNTAKVFTDVSVGNTAIAGAEFDTAPVGGIAKLVLKLR